MDPSAPNSSLADDPCNWEAPHLDLHDCWLECQDLQEMIALALELFFPSADDPRADNQFLLEVAKVQIFKNLF